MSNCIPENAEWFLDEFDAERFWSLVNFRGGTGYVDDPLADSERVRGECWKWMGKTDGAVRPYGRFRLYGKDYPSHRVAYRDFGKRLGDDEVADHLCRETLCVNPDHLEAVTQTENVRRGRLPILNRGTCNHGHEMTPENTVIRARKGGKSVRGCKACLTASARRSYLKRKSAGLT